MALQAVRAPSATSLPSRPPSQGRPACTACKSRAQVLAAFVVAPEVTAWAGLIPRGAACRRPPAPALAASAATCAAAGRPTNVCAPIL